jgi:hypothetical protein
MKQTFVGIFFSWAAGSTVLLSASINSLSASSFKATDPGVRGGAAGAGGPIQGLSFTQRAFFAAGKQAFESEEDVAQGLGPRMNLDSCVGCHAYPAAGGSSPLLTTYPNPCRVGKKLSCFPMIVLKLILKRVRIVLADKCSFGLRYCVGLLLFLLIL